MGACASCSKSTSAAEQPAAEPHVNQHVVVSEMTKQDVTKHHPPTLQTENPAATISLNQSTATVVPVDDASRLSLSAAPTDSPIAKRVVHIDLIRRSVHAYEPHVPSSRADAQHGQTNVLDSDKAMLQQQIKSLNSFKSMSRNKSASAADHTPTSQSPAGEPASASPCSVSDVAWS